MTPEFQPCHQMGFIGGLHHWPSNFAELREIADAIIAHATLGGMRRAAASLGVSRQKLTRRLERVGLTLPLFCQNE